MTTANYTRPNYSTQSGTVYPAGIDAMARVFERSASAFAPHEQTAGSPAPDLTVVVDAGPVLDISRAAPDLNEMAQQTVSGFTIPSAGQSRIDRVVINDTTGLAERVAGTAVTTGGSPSAAPPDIPARRLPVCQVAIASTDTAITNDMLTDERCGVPVKTSRARRGATVARSSDTILDAGDYDRTILATGTFTQTLTAAAVLGDGWYCFYRNDGVGSITLDPNARETIDGATTKALAAAQSCMIICDGSNFKTVGLGSATVAATQAEMEAGSDNTVMATPLNAKWAPSAAKAFARWNSAGTIAVNSSINMASISDGGVGIWDAQIATDFASATSYTGVAYGGVKSGVAPLVYNTFIAGAAGSFSVRASKGDTVIPSYADPDAPDEIHAVLFGDQA